MKCFGLTKRKSNIFRNNHFAVIVGASIGPCQRQVMISFTRFIFSPTVCHQFCFYLVGMLLLFSGGKRHVNYCWMCCVLWGNTTIIAWQILTTLKLLAFRWSFGLFLHRKNKQKCLSRRKWLGLVFFSSSLKWAGKCFHQKNGRVNLYMECMYT